MNDVLRQLQIEETKMLAEFITFMEQHGLRYFILAGTCLGAVRHRGFVPWDDDIDIGVPRKDYEELIKITASSKCLGSMNVSVVYDDYSLLYYPLKLFNRDVTIYTKSDNREEKTNAWLTLFPLDGMPSNRFLRFVHGKVLLLCRMGFNYARGPRKVNYKDKRKPLLKRVMDFILLKSRLYQLFGERRSTNRLDHTLKKYSYDNSEYVVTIMGGYKLKEMFPKSVFAHGANYVFEGVNVIGPADYERYLTQLYGDWRTPPPENDPDRNRHNIVKVDFKH